MSKGINSKEVKVPKEQCISEFQKFFEYHRDDEISAEQIKTDYLPVLKAMIKGHLILKDNKFYLTLRESLKDTENVDYLKEINSESIRISPLTARDIFEGINPSTNPNGYFLQAVSYITKIEIGIIDKINKHDLNVINLLIPLFL